MRNLSSDKILILCDSFRRTQPLLASCGVTLHISCAVCFPSGEVIDHVGIFSNRDLNEDPFPFAFVCFVTAASRFEKYSSLKSHCSSITPLLIRLGDNRLYRLPTSRRVFKFVPG